MERSCDVYSNCNCVPHSTWGSRCLLILLCLEANSPLHPCLFCSVHYVCKIELCSVALGVCEVRSLCSRGISLIHSVIGYLQCKGMAIALCFDLEGPYVWENLKLILLLNTMPRLATSSGCSFPCHFQVLGLCLHF